jgi:hypothetical protein
MAGTILYGDRPVSVVNATAEGNNLWLSLDDLRATTGWELSVSHLLHMVFCAGLCGS